MALALDYPLEYLLYGETLRYYVEIYGDKCFDLRNWDSILRRMDADGLLVSGVLIRHLILPGHTEESRGVIDEVADRFPPGSVLFSLMSQYTPMPFLQGFPELRQRVGEEENRSLIHYMKVRHLEDGYWQELREMEGELVVTRGDFVAIRPKEKTDMKDRMHVADV